MVNAPSINVSFMHCPVFFLILSHLNFVSFATFSHCKSCFRCLWVPLLCVCAESCLQQNEYSWEGLATQKDFEFSSAEINSSFFPFCNNKKINLMQTRSTEYFFWGSVIHILLHMNLQTLYKQACCFSINALEVTGHLSLVVPLCVLQDKHPAVLRWDVVFLGRHIGVDRGQDPVRTGDGENHFAIQQPHHNSPPCVGGAAGKPGLVSSQNG